MITRRTKVQLLIFVIITLLGVSFVGARYARLDEKVRDTSYEVTAHFGEAGGIFAGAEVTYRGVGIGTVDRLELTNGGVDVVLKIENSWDDIPAASVATVGNRSAVGEQYVELQPKTNDGASLAEGSQIPITDTRTPIATETLLADLSRTTSSVNQDALRVSVDELGKAFNGTGDDLQQIIDTGTSFINAADANFDVTTKLIEDSNTVLNTQIDSESDLRTFADQLALFSGTLADADPDLRRLIDNGSFAANQLRTFIEENRIDLGSLINDLVTTGEIFVKHIDGLQQVLVIYPYVVEAGFTVVAKSPGSGKFDAHFGAIMSSTSPCTHGYEGTNRRSPQDRFTDPGMNLDARCTDPAAVSNPRGAQNIPRAGTSFGRPDAFFDPDTGELTYTDAADPDPVAPWEAASSMAPRSLGKESWKWLYLEPMTGQ